MKPTRRYLIVVLALAVLAVIAIPSAEARHRGPLSYIGPQPAPSIFGIDTSIFDTNHSYFVRDVPAARGLGARWDHFTLGPATGTGKFGPLDWQVRQARKYRMGVILSFGGIARACSQPTSNPHACPPTTAADLRAFDGYVRHVVLHYRNVVTYYESWVEPNNAASWRGGAHPAQYATVLEAEYSVLQAVNRQYGLHLQLLFASPAGFATKPGTGDAVLPFTDAVLAHLHGQREFDGIALHAYRFPPSPYGPATPACDYVGGLQVSVGYSTLDCPAPDWRWMSWPQELQAYEQMFQNHGYGQQPLWLTEFGWPGNSVAAGDYFPSDVTQTADLTLAYTDLLAMPFVKAALWFNIRDYQPGDVTGDPSFFYHYGLLNYDLSPKPAAAAFRALADLNPGR